MQSRTEQLFLFSVTMTLVFGALMIWSLVSGTEVANTEIPEAVFSQEEVTDAPIQFVHKKSGPLTMTLTGTTLNNSWLWAKAVILDSENVAVQEHDFDLSYYYGPDWSEGNRSDDWTFRLPAGQYQVLVYGENEGLAQGTPRPTHGDILKVEIESDIVLSRYFVLGFILFLIMSLRANKLKSDDLNRSRNEANRHTLFS